MLVERFEKGAVEAGKDPATMPKIIQLKVSYAETDDKAVETAVKEWPNGGMAFPKGDIRNPEDFEAMARLVKPEHFRNRVLMTADLDAHSEYAQHFLDLGFTEVIIHNVNREQEAFIEAYGRHVLPNLTW
jgi:alkanesulfonate monooxygenase SsuD/methylene tetrahydromethanopterin reductase-like flavin-dependent oxidoreductase (luciferase family)